MKFITKKTYPILLVLVPLLLYLVYMFFRYVVCYWYIPLPNSTGMCSDYFLDRTLFDGLVFASASFFISTFPLWLLSLPFKVQVFETWKKFATWAVPVLIILLSWLSSIDTGGGWGPEAAVRGAMLLSVIIVLTGAYFLISLVIISVTWWKSRKG